MIAALMGCTTLLGVDKDYHPVEDDGESTGGASGGGGTGGYQPPTCPGDPVADPALVRNDCGTFVSASAAPGGDGTMERPLQSFSEAAALGAKRIYACAESYTETAAVAFSEGVEIFAGFTECFGAWTWAEGSRATLNGAAHVPALTLSGGSNLLRNLNVMAANAATPGSSSIAVVMSGGSLEARDGDLTAGYAMDGAAGAEIMPDVALDGEPGDPGVGVCGSGVNNPGPVGKTKMCLTGDMSVGGKGGDGGELMGTTLLAAGSGSDGTPPDATQPTRGKGGVGEGVGTPPAAACDPGTTGADGAVGASGAGASGIGELSINGYRGVDGAPGMNGKPGQGGGGGGGAKGGLSISCPGGGTANRVGGSGGAGGTGGCGGAAGPGGMAGGSSIALIAIDTTLTLTSVLLMAGRAGNGGVGSDGQTGGSFGARGVQGAGAGAAKNSCAGGNGGVGGHGGPGGGGQGGHSLAMALQGTTAPGGAMSTIDPMNVGTGGPGGANNAAPNGGAGADGVAADCWDFTDNAACGG